MTIISRGFVGLLLVHVLLLCFASFVPFLDFSFWLFLDAVYIRLDVTKKATCQSVRVRAIVRNDLASSLASLAYFLPGVSVPVAISKRR